MKQCPSCNSSILDAAKFCPKCGATISSDAAGRQSGEDAVLISGSGSSSRNIPPPPPPSRSATASTSTKSAPVQAQSKSSNGLLFAVIGLVAVLVVGAVGYFVISRNEAESDVAAETAMDPEVATPSLSSPTPAQSQGVVSAAAPTQVPISQDQTDPSATEYVPDSDEPIVPPQQAFAVKPSFDCAKASSIDEQLVCANEDLAELDMRLASEYKKALSLAREPDRLRADQKGWIKAKRACEDHACLLSKYEERMSFFQDRQYLNYGPGVWQY